MLDRIGLYLWELQLPPGELIEHVHRHAFFCVLLDGALEYSGDGGTIRFGPQRNVFHPPGMVHSGLAGQQGAHLMTMDVTAQWFDRLGADYALPRTPVALAHAERSLARRLLQELRGCEPCSTLVIEGLALQLLAAAARSRERREPGADWLARVIELLHEEFARQWTLKEISAGVGVSPALLSSVFRQHSACGLGEYLRRIRVEYVRGRLSSDESLASIALAAGFADQAHCTRVFKKVVGQTPGVYRAGLRAARHRSFCASPAGAAPVMAKGPAERP